MLSADSDCLADRHRGFPREKGGEVMEAARAAPTTWPPCSGLTSLALLVVGG